MLMLTLLLPALCLIACATAQNQLIDITPLVSERITLHDPTPTGMFMAKITTRVKLDRTSAQNSQARMVYKAGKDYLAVGLAKVDDGPPQLQCRERIDGVPELLEPSLVSEELPVDLADVSEHGVEVEFTITRAAHDSPLTVVAGVAPHGRRPFTYFCQTNLPYRLQGTFQGLLISPHQPARMTFTPPEIAQIFPPGSQRKLEMNPLQGLTKRPLLESKAERNSRIGKYEITHDWKNQKKGK